MSIKTGLNTLLNEKLAIGLCFLILTVLIVFAFYVRLHDIEVPGLTGSDVVFYTTIAESWKDGQPIYSVGAFPTVYRPVFYWLMAASFKLFGHHDTAVKLFHFFISILNVLLATAILYHTLRKSFVPDKLSKKEPKGNGSTIKETPIASRAPLFLLILLACALFYASLPADIYMARTELTSTISSLMVLSSYFFLVLYSTANDSPWRFLYLTLCGTLAGCAALTHEELILLLPGYALCVVLSWQGLPQDKTERRKAAGDLLSFVVICSLVVLPLLFEVSRQPHPSLDSDSTGLGRLITGLGRTLRFYWNPILVSSSVFFQVLFLLILGSIGVRSAKRWAGKTPGAPRVPRTFYFPLLILTVFAVGCGYFLHTYLLRLFLPLFPLILIFVGAWSYFFLQGLPRLRSMSAVGVFCLLMIAANYGNFRTYSPRSNLPLSGSWLSPDLASTWNVKAGIATFKTYCYTRGWPKRVYLRMEDLVKEDARLLMASSIMTPFAGRRELQVGFYFGDNALYMIDHTESLDELIDRYQIRYVLLSAYDAHQSLLEQPSYEQYQYQGRWQMSPLHLGAPYGFEPGTYSLEREFDFVLDYLAAQEATLIEPPFTEADATKEKLTEYLESGSWRYVVFELPRPE